MLYDVSNPMREKQLNIRLSPEEAQRLDSVASHYSLSSAAAIRMLVKREADQIQAEAEQRGKRRERFLQDDVQNAIRMSGVKGLRVKGHNKDAGETTLTDGKQTRTVDEDEAANAAAHWPGSKIRGWDPDNSNWVIRGSARDKELSRTVAWWGKDAKK